MKKRLAIALLRTFSAELIQDATVALIAERIMQTFRDPRNRRIAIDEMAQKIAADVVETFGKPLDSLEA